jgi:hypothetical protein
VRGALNKIEGVADIQTDPTKAVASFKVKKGVEYKTKLEELAKNNQHLKDFEIVN